AGETIAFQPGAVVRGAMVGSGGQAAANQRRRWEFGRREIGRKALAPLLRSGHLKWWEKLVSACETSKPAIGPLFLLFLFAKVLDLLAWHAPAWQDWAVARASLLAWWLLLTAAMGLYAVSPFLAMRLPGKYLASLAFFPLYLAWKFVVSLGGRPTG